MEKLSHWYAEHCADVLAVVAFLAAVTVVILLDVEIPEA